MMIIDNEYAMQELGERLAHAIDGGIVMTLVGDVGAGKTTLVHGIAKGMGIDETVQSPSFTISRVYDSPGRRLVHYDFYRLDDPGIMADELAETVTGDDVVVIEWAAAVDSILPSDHMIVTIVPHGDTARAVTLNATGPKSKSILERMA